MGGHAVRKSSQPPDKSIGPLPSASATLSRFITPPNCAFYPEAHVTHTAGDELHMIQQSRLYFPDPERTRRTSCGSAEAFQALMRKSVEAPGQFWAEVAGELEWLRRMGHRSGRRLPALPVLFRRREQPDAQSARPAPRTRRRQSSGARLGRREFRHANSSPTGCSPSK